MRPDDTEGMGPVGTNGPCLNTDRHLWPDTSAPNAPHESLFVTIGGGIGINVGGHVIVMALSKWHALAQSRQGESPALLTSNEPLSDLYTWLLDTSNESSPYESQMLTRAAAVVGEKLLSIANAALHSAVETPAEPMKLQISVVGMPKAGDICNHCGGRWYVGLSGCGIYHECFIGGSPLKTSGDSHE